MYKGRLTLVNNQIQKLEIEYFNTFNLFERNINNTQISAEYSDESSSDDEDEDEIDVQE